MKQQSAFDQSRPVMFRKLYDKAIEDLRSGLSRVDHRGYTRIWTGGATRQRVRKLARENARLALYKRRHQAAPNDHLRTTEAHA